MSESEWGYRVRAIVPRKTWFTYWDQRSLEIAKAGLKDVLRMGCTEGVIQRREIKQWEEFEDEQ